MLINVHYCVAVIAVLAVASMVYSGHIITSVLREYLERITDVVADSKQREEALKQVLETLIREGYRK